MSFHEVASALSGGTLRLRLRADVETTLSFGENWLGYIVMPFKWVPNRHENNFNEN